MNTELNPFSLLLPEVIFQYFDCINYTVLDDKISFFLDEKSNRPIKEGFTYTSKGFTEAKAVQDFPIRGKAVYLHIRRRKYLEEETGNIITSRYDLNHIGTQISQEFTVFLKGIH